MELSFFGWVEGFSVVAEEASPCDEGPGPGVPDRGDAEPSAPGDAEGRPIGSAEC